MSTSTTRKRAGKPLTASEIPAELHQVYNLSSQQLDTLPRHAGKNMTIERTCPKCGKCERILVHIIRIGLKQGTLEGTCQQCHSRGKNPNGSNSFNWKGGRRISQFGYMMLYQPDHPMAQSGGYIPEHRLIMEKCLGRSLLPTETVHHKNGIKTDNRIENLELWMKSHSDGIRYNDLDIQQLEDLIMHLQAILTAKRVITQHWSR